MSSNFNQFATNTPEDAEVRNIIDKLAIFVARNGQEFERMTMEKQRDNPKFQFLFGGEFHQYYRLKVSQEQAAMYSQSQAAGGGGVQPLIQPGPPAGMMPPQPGFHGYQQPPPNFNQQPPPNFNQPPPSQPAPEHQWPKRGSGETLLQTLKQTRLSEQASLQQPGSIDPLEAEFSTVVGPIMESCTKDAISEGKGWIIAHTQSPDACQAMARMIMRKTLNAPGVGFNQKLHIIYLINDILHHCLRKGLQDLRQALGAQAVQIFYNTYVSEPDKSDSLNKVLKIWTGQEYFNKNILDQIEAVVAGKADTIPAQVDPGPPVNPSLGPGDWQGRRARSSRWDNVQPLFPESHPDLPPPPPPPRESRDYREEEQRAMKSFDYNHGQRGEAQPVKEVFDYNHGSQFNQPQQQFDYNRQEPPHAMPPPEPRPPQLMAAPGEPPPLMGPPPTGDMPHPHPPLPPMMRPPPNPMHMGPVPIPPPGAGPILRPPGPPGWAGLPPAAHIPMQGPPPNMPPGPGMPRPPHGEPWPRVEAPPLPAVPYYELPAGIMVTLVPLHEHSYRSINPHHVVLPPPQPPTDRLLKAVEEFYQQEDNEGETEDNKEGDKVKRNEEGWEAGALLGFFEAKRKAKEDMTRRQRPRRPLPPLRRRSRSPRHSRRSRSRSYSRSRSRSYSRSRSRSDSRSRSYSRSPRRRRSSRSPTSSRSRSRSPSPAYKRSPQRQPRRDSPPRGLGFQQAPPTSIGEGNVGHQMMRRMGWEGAGLGAAEQGIQEPVKGGDVRETADKYKGVGMSMADPFEMFRRNRSYTYNRRPRTPEGQ